MKVALDAQQTVGTATGIGEYVRGLLAALPGTGVDAIALRAPGFDPWRFDRRAVWDQVLLPLAALRLKQGFGRLIRSKTDRGIVVILDNRIVTKPYGRAFMQALPKCPVEIV